MGGILVTIVLSFLCFTCYSFTTRHFRSYACTYHSINTHTHAFYPIQTLFLLKNERTVIQTLLPLKKEWILNIRMVKNSGQDDEETLVEITRNSLRSALLDISIKSLETIDRVPHITSTDGYPFWWEIK